MKMLIVRHGEAEPNKGDDVGRVLTTRGESQVKTLWEALHEKGVCINRLVVSPYVRTQQTAAIIAGFYPDAVCETEPLLACETNPDDVLEWLLQQPLEKGLVLVSHMPLVAILAGMLTDSAKARIPFAPGMVACLDVEVAAIAGARLRWCICPETGVVK